MTIEYEKINDCEPNVGSIKPVGYDVAMVVFPEIKSPEYPRAITSGGAAWVDAQRGYGAWAHELGHALYGYGDLAPHSEAEMEAGHSDIRYWGLMSIGWSTNPPSPITLFDKNESEWIEWNTKS